MKAFTIYLGLTTRGGHKIPKKGAVQTASDLLLKSFQIKGATFTFGQGIWNGEKENVLLIYVSDPTVDLYIEEICQCLAHDFSQEYVGYHSSPVLTLVANPLD